MRELGLYLFCLAVVTVLLSGPAAHAYQWHEIPIGAVEQPTYEIQFGGGSYFAGTEYGVYCGFGYAGGWEGMGLDYPGLGAYSILYRDGDGWRKHLLNETPLPGATGVALGDLDQNGYADVVVAAKDPSDCVVWLDNPLPSTINPHWNVYDVDPTEDGAREVAIDDIDNDGDLDIAAAIRDEGEIVWYENSGTADPINWIRHHVGYIGGPRGVFIGDINEDGWLDIVAGGMDVGTVLWFEAPTDDSDIWTPHIVDTDLPGVKGVFAINIDCDGDLDIIAAGRDVGHVVWYEHLNSGEPDAWVKHMIDDNLSGAVSVWCGNLVGGEDPEVAVTSKLMNMVVVYEASGPGGTGPWIRTVVDSPLVEACPIAAGDFDGDGRTDLAAAGRGGELVAWYKAPEYSGQYWQKFVVDDEAGHSMGLTTGDVDNDGDTDLVVTTCPEGTVTWYENDIRDIFCAFSEGSGFCESDGIYRWHDERQEWVASFWCPRPYFILEHPLLPGVYLCGSQAGLYISTDGATWTEVGGDMLPEPVLCAWFHPTDYNIMMMGTDQGLYRTDDGGLHWVLIGDIPELPVTDIATGYFDNGPSEAVLFATVGSGTFWDGLYRSFDMGFQWERICDIVQPTDLIQDFSDHHHPLVMFVATLHNGILRVDVEGEVLGDINQGLPDVPIHRMRYDPYIDTIALFGCTDIGLYACMLLELTDVSSGAGLPGNPCRVWPNPSRGFIDFRLSDQNSGDLSNLRLFDPLGRVIWSSSGRISEGGLWTARWDGMDRRGMKASPGVYFYQIESSGREYGGKIVRLE